MYHATFHPDLSRDVYKTKKKTNLELNMLQNTLGSGSTNEFTEEDHLS